MSDGSAQDTSLLSPTQIKKEKKKKKKKMRADSDVEENIPAEATEEVGIGERVREGP